MPLLDVRDLTVEIAARGAAPGAAPAGEPTVIVRDLSFRLERGESLGVVGESGCGKSMTALAILGLLPEGIRARGRILLDGVDLLAAGEDELCRVRGRRIGMVFQEPMTALDPVRTIGDQVAEGLRLHLGADRATARDEARRLLDRVGLPAPRFSPDLYPHELSGGERQRVMLAAALACGPELLIADEPTTALDVTTQAQILDLLVRLVDEEGMAFLLITHDLAVIAETTDAMLVMYAGRILERGPTAAVFRRLAHPYSRGLWQAMPHAVARKAPLRPIPGQVPAPGARPAGCVFADRCPRTQDVCRAERPFETPVVGAGSNDAGGDAGRDAGHRAACFFPMIEEAP